MQNIHTHPMVVWNHMGSTIWKRWSVWYWENYNIPAQSTHETSDATCLKQWISQKHKGVIALFIILILLWLSWSRARLPSPFWNQRCTAAENCRKNRSQSYAATGHPGVTTHTFLGWCEGKLWWYLKFFSVCWLLRKTFHRAVATSMFRFS